MEKIDGSVTAASAESGAVIFRSGPHKAETFAAIAEALDADTAKAQGRTHYATFAPHYFVEAGSDDKLKCGSGGEAWNPLHPHCGRQCSNQGRYVSDTKAQHARRPYTSLPHLPLVELNC